MPTILSRLARHIEIWSFKYNCYETVHPWTPYCSDGALDIGSTVFFEAIKLYTPLYLFSQFMRRRYDSNSFKETGSSILRSASFVSTNAYLAIFFFCTSRKVAGKFYYYLAAYIPGILASFLAIGIERPTRRSALAFYVANVATETLFRIAVAKGLIKAVNNGQVYIFTISIALIMMMAKRNGFEDDPLSTAIRIIVGHEEACPRKRKSPHRDQQNNLVICDSNEAPDEKSPHYISRINQQDEPITSSGGKHCKTSYLNSILKMKEKLVTILHAQHKLCPHKDKGSCVHYVVKSSMRSFLIGYLGQLSLKLLTRSYLIVKDPSILKGIVTQRQTLNLGLFLSTFTALYKITNCTLRWTTDSSNAMNCFIASIVAGPAMFFYPSSTISLYVMWKCLEALFHEAVRLGIIRHKNFFIICLYSIATSQLFYSAVLDPRYMKSSYMTFLDRMSDHRLHLLNRSVLDVFGTEASSGYEDFFPNLHPKFISTSFKESIWIWLLEQKFPANYIR